MKVASLLLAAGLSGRMNAFKPLLKYKDKPIVVHIAEKLIDCCEKVILVTGYKNLEIESAFFEAFHSGIEKLKFVFNENYKLGMFSSLQKGIKEVSEYDWALYHFVDQPGLLKNFYTELINQIDNEFDWIQPLYNNLKGHPILLNKKIYNVILSSDAHSSLKAISLNFKKKFYNCTDENILLDIDTKDDYSLLKEKD